jgi:hypothetical protein
MTKYECDICYEKFSLSRLLHLHKKTHVNDDTLENDLRPVIETRKNLFMIPYDYYNYCGFYDKSLLSRRLYFTGDFKTDFTLFLFFVSLTHLVHAVKKCH